jgi:ATP-dependent Lon protease
MPDEKTDGLWQILSHPTIPKEYGNSLKSGADDDVLRVPPHLSILPLRGMVVFPMTAVPIRVGQPRSIRLIDDAVTGKRLVGLVASHDPELETPGPDDVYRIGTVAAVHRLFKSPDGTITLIMQGLMRIRVEEFIDESPYLTARVSIVPERIEKSSEIEALRRSIADGFQRLSELAPAVPEEMSTLVINMEDPLQLAYAVAN